MIHHGPHPPVRLDDTPVHELVRRGLERRRDEIAVVEAATGADPARLRTGAEMLELIERRAARLAAAGLARGEVVGLAAPGGADWLAEALGALSLGSTVLPLNPALPAQLAGSAIQASGARVVIAAAPVAAWAAEAAEAAGPDVAVIPFDLDEPPRRGAGAGTATGEATAGTAGGEATAGSAGGEAGPREPGRALPGVGGRPDGDDADRTAFLLASSGTSGLPKLVRVTHRSFGATLRLVPAAMALTGDDVILAALPLFHAGGLTVALVPLACGARLVVQPSFDPAAFVAAIEEHRVTGTVVVPPICQALLGHPAVEGRDLSSLRFVQSTAAPLAPAVQVGLADRLGCHVGQGLGLSEALPVSLSSPTHPSPPGASGRAVPNTELRLVDPGTGLDVPGTDAVGELWVRGPQVMAGYLDDPAATEAALTPDGWLVTGDLCRIDGDGNVFVVDRLKELIKVSGYQVAPAAVEAALLAHPAVGDCAVVGRPDDRRGEVPVAFVVARGPVEPDELVEMAAAATPPYARLAEVVLVDAIPRNPTGKILRRILAERLRGGATAGRASATTS